MDAPPSPVGRPVPRHAARRLVAGRGNYTDDHVRPGLLHAAVLRSPSAHGRIVRLDISAAAARPDVIRVLTAADIDAVCRPMRVVLENLPGHVSPVQPALAGDEVRYVGEPVALVVARSRAAAEDALDRIVLGIDELPAVAGLAAALAPDAPSANGVAGNIALRLPLDRARPGIQAGTQDGTAEGGGIAVAQRFRFGRVTAVSLEGRSILADYNPGDRTLTVIQPHQSPHLAQAIYARHFDIPEQQVRVIAPDVGGAFGLKMHVFPDEMAAVAASRILGRPVALTLDRTEGLLSDAHAREAEVDATLTLGADGAPGRFDVRVRAAIGAYSIYPRGSLGDPFQTLTMAGAPYRLARLSGEALAVYQNKAPSGPIRGVGQPLACAVTEVMIDHAARAVGEDPADYRRRCYLGDDDFPGVTPGGLALDRLSLAACHDALLELMDYRALRAGRKTPGDGNIRRGIGLAAFVEQTAVGAGLYGPAGLPVSAQDTAVVRLEPSGTLRVEVGCTDQGQGTLTGIAQIAAAAFGVGTEHVAVRAGDSAGAYGGGAWASRGLAISGEATNAAAAALRAEVLRLAGMILQADPTTLALRDGNVCDGSGVRLAVADVAAIAHFRQDQLPPGVQPQLTAAHSHIPRDFPYAMANGIQGCHLEVDIETGAIRLLGHWVVEDCGRIVNPLLVDEQIRGGVVHGLGNALFEECLYDEAGQMQSATMADYLVPLAGEMPDIVVSHIETPQRGSVLGIKGAGEAGTVGAMAAVWCALNDALAELGAEIREAPFTPERVLAALGRVKPPDPAGTAI